MMSIKRMHAGEGYQYLLRSVADGEGSRLTAAGSPMTRYYTEAGTPPGQWHGHGLAGLDRGVGLPAGSVVTGEQMERLFKHGVDPTTGDRLARKAFEVPQAWRDRVDRRVLALPAGLDPASLRERVAAIEAEERGRQVRRPVAGFDLTFSPPKSLSVLWGLAGPELRDQLYAAHRAAVADTLALIERDVARTRVGTDGVAQVRTRGVVAAAFDHFDSRAGDPQLHTHVVIANRVQGLDGTWRTLDSNGALFPAVVAMSESYDALLADHVTARTGLGWEPRGNPRKPKNQRWEVAGVPEALIGEFSRRAAGIEEEKDRLVADWTAAHGRVPDDAAVIRLRQQATLATRPDKEARSLAELSADWRARARQALGADPAAWSGLPRAPDAGTSTVRLELRSEQVDEYATQVIDRLVSERSTWRRWNVHAEAARVTMAHRMPTAADRDRLITAVVERALSRSLALSSPVAAHTPAAFLDPDGSSAFDPASRDVFTAESVLDAEARLLTASRDTGGPRVTDRTAARAARTATIHSRALSDDQADALTAIATSRRPVDLLVGPAGAGKTTALAALHRAWEVEHGTGSVIGLAPSAAAADVLGEALGIAAENTAKWVTEHRRINDPAGQRRHDEAVATLRAAAAAAHRRGDTKRARHHQDRISELTHDRDRWQLRPGQLVIVDEASLAGTITIDTITTAATEAGAKVLLVGDWAQLSAVEAGGAFGMLVRDRPDVPELIGIRRFTEEWEGDASTRLRVGDETVITDYTDHGRVTGGEHEAMIDTAYTAWAADAAAGRASLLIAGDNHTVRALNERARADRVRWGQVHQTGARLYDGSTAGVGDQIVTRHNDRSLRTGRGWVKNGDRWQVTVHHRDGSLQVRRTAGGTTLTLPSDYVAEYVDLGYAATAHRAQGATVDTAHAIVTGPGMTREVLYVALTRGRHSNNAYVCTDHDTHGVCEPGTSDEQPWTTQSVLAAVLRNRGAQPSAHETIQAELDQRHSIKVLAAEYDTIARHAHSTRWRDLLDATGWDTATVNAVLATPAGGSLVSVFRRADVYGLDLGTALPQLVATAPTPTAAEAGTELTQQVQRWVDTTADPARRTQRRFVAGLVPVADPTGDTDVDAALADREALMTARAAELVTRAARDREPWLTSLGNRPAYPVSAAAWERCAATVAAYRDRHDITTPAPLGTDQPRSWTRRADHRRAAIAIETASRLAAGTDHGDRTLGPAPAQTNPRAGPNLTR